MCFMPSSKDRVNHIKNMIIRTHNMLCMYFKIKQICFVKHTTITQDKNSQYLMTIVLVSEQVLPQRKTDLDVHGTFLKHEKNYVLYVSQLCFSHVLSRGDTFDSYYDQQQSKLVCNSTNKFREQFVKIDSCDIV